LESPKVSRRHALIHLQNIGELWLIDFGSSNETNRQRLVLSYISDPLQLEASPRWAKKV
jgi:pSer/pThr/pTyr-binding forkhead associated (FHA) protein